MVSYPLTRALFFYYLDLYIYIDKRSCHSKTWVWEVDMKLESLNDVLTFAIRREHDARELYVMLRNIVKDPGSKALLEDLAKQELSHRDL